MHVGTDVLILILPLAACLVILVVIIWAVIQRMKGYPKERDLPPEPISLRLPRPRHLPLEPVSRRDESDPPRGAA